LNGPQSFLLLTPKLPFLQQADFLLFTAKRLDCRRHVTIESDWKRSSLRFHSPPLRLIYVFFSRLLSQGSPWSLCQIVSTDYFRLRVSRRSLLAVICLARSPDQFRPSFYVGVDCGITFSCLESALSWDSGEDETPPPFLCLYILLVHVFLWRSPFRGPSFFHSGLPTTPVLVGPTPDAGNSRPFSFRHKSFLCVLRSSCDLSFSFAVVDLPHVCCIFILSFGSLIGP